MATEMATVNGHGKWPRKMTTEMATENGYGYGHENGHGKSYGKKSYGKSYEKIWKWLRVHLDPRTESCDGSFGLDAQHSGIQH